MEKKTVTKKNRKARNIHKNQESEILDAYLDKFKENDDEIYMLAAKLMFSGFYGIEIYQRLEEITEGSDMEKHTKELRKYLKNIEELPLNKILETENSIFDGLRAEYIAAKIGKIENPGEKIKYIDMFHKKCFYMMANDEISDYDKIYIPQVFLRYFYNRKIEI